MAKRRGVYEIHGGGARLTKDADTRRRGPNERGRYSAHMPNPEHRHRIEPRGAQAGSRLAATETASSAAATTSSVSGSEALTP